MKVSVLVNSEANTERNIFFQATLILQTLLEA